MIDRHAAAFRAFNRFFTQRIGALNEGLSSSPFSLTAARVLYELAHRPNVAAVELSDMLSLDPGYLTRILQGFERQALLVRDRDPEDGRRQRLNLTEAGQSAFAPLNDAAQAEATALLSRLPKPARAELTAAFQRIEALLGDPRDRTWSTRDPRPGDIGWVVDRHGALYAEEYGFDHRFEALVAQVAGEFLATHDPAHEQCWIAEHRGIRVGSVFLVRKSAEIAKLRLLIVEPEARGLGIGRGLVRLCIQRARDLGYRKIVLWTNDILLAARAIYKAEGFRLTASHPHSDFGPPMAGEDWELDL